MIKVKKMIDKVKSKKKYDIIDEFEKEHINSVINFSNIESSFDSELIQLIIDHTSKKTIVYKLNIKSVVSTLTKRPTLNKRNNNYMVDIPALEKIDEWSGLSYELEFDSNQLNEDRLFEDNGVKILVDKKSLLYLVGTTLDYSGGLNGKGFVFNNPNANRTCGCGESFSL